VRVKLLSIDEKGKMRLSRKAALAEEQGAAAPAGE
jgi:predicted RNA-binding protein with RPS1 domain